MFTTRPELIGYEGMATSTHWLVSHTSMRVLDHGGNAFDAAVAGAFVLNVIQPEQNSPGGEVPIVGYDARTQRPFVVNGQGPSPEALTPQTFSELGLDFVPSDGLVPACVPGMFGSLTLLAERYGTWRLRDLLEPAIGYAEQGYPLTPLTALVIGDAQDRFRTHWQSNGEIYLPGGRAPNANQRVTNPDLAATWRRVVSESEVSGRSREEEFVAARDIWYRGFVAEAIDKFHSTPAMDSTGEEHVGYLRYSDLAAWEPSIEEPVTLDYHGYTLCKPNTWSQGPVLLQQLGLLEHFELDAMQPASAELIHTVVECAKLAYADREAYYGDPDFVKVPLDRLLSANYNADRRQLIGPEASADLIPGSIDGVQPRMPFFAQEGVQAAGNFLPIPYIPPGSGRTNGDTVHLDVVDKHGNLVSVTPSGGFLWGSPVVPGLGFSVSTRAQIFSVEQGLPNSLQPGKRPRTTLSPSLVLRDGEGYLAFGTPGGDMQDQWPLEFFLNHVHFDMNLQEAIDAPTWHTTHFPSSFMGRASSRKTVHVESRVGEETIEKLRAWGHDVKVQDPWSLGMVCAVSREQDGTLRGGASPRGLLGYAIGR